MTAVRLPWPGPVPYDEEDWGCFFGRRAEVSQVMSRLRDSRLTVLTGDSASGKTSILRAGVVPALRLARYGRPGAADTGPGAGAAPLTLVLRNWGALRSDAGGTADETILLGAMKSGCPDTSLWGETTKSDADVVQAALAAAGGSFARAVADCAHRAKGVVVILDQFEEVLRAQGNRRASPILGAIAEVFDTVPGATLLLSLRREHVTELRALESHVGPIFHRAVFLEPMRDESLVDSILASGKAGSVHVEKDAATHLVHVHREDEFARDDDGQAPAPNLLAVQAILRAVVAGDHGASKPALTMERIGAYRERRGGAPLAQAALADWIQGALRPENAPAEVARAVESWGLAPDERTSWEALVERTTTRMVPHLASGGFKVAQARENLRWQTLQGDLRALADAEGKSVAPPGPRRVKVTQELLSDTNGNDVRRSPMGGLAHARRWSSRTTVGALTVALDDAAGRLLKANVLKPGVGPGGNSVLELVHDGLGEPLERWAESRKGSFRDCVGALVVVRGLSPIRVESEVTGAFHRLRWQGCGVRRDAAGMTRAAVTDDVATAAQFRRAVFRECDFTGTIFERCRFVGVRFEDCVLDGTVFRDCRFECDADGAPTTFAGGEPESMAILDSVVSGLAFEGCNLSQFTCSEAHVDGTWAVRDGRLRCCRFVRCDGAPGAVTFPGTSLSYCAWDAPTGERRILDLDSAKDWKTSGLEEPAASLP